MLFRFWIRRKRTLPIEKCDIEAKNQNEAINKLPACVSWNFRLPTYKETSFGRRT